MESHGAEYAALSLDRRSGSFSVEVFGSTLSAEIYFTRWPDGSASISGDLRLEPR